MAEWLSLVLWRMFGVDGKLDLIANLNASLFDSAAMER